MWKKEDARPQGVPETSSSFVPGPVKDATSPAATGRGAASIGQGIRIKGEINGQRRSDGGWSGGREIAVDERQSDGGPQRNREGGTSPPGK